MSFMTPDERIDRIRGDHWIAFDRATIVLNRLTSLMEMPQQSRMSGLMVYGSSGIGKTMIAYSAGSGAARAGRTTVLSAYPVDDRSADVGAAYRVRARGPRAQSSSRHGPEDADDR
jgi:hypothetical protein